MARVLAETSAQLGSDGEREIEVGDAQGFHNVFVGLTDPPGYLVRVVLIDGFGLRDYGRADKVNWQTYLGYKGHSFKVRDFKFGTWSVESRSDPDAARAIGEELVRTIQDAAAQVDRELAPLLRREIDAERYFLDNAFARLQRLYRFYASRTRTAWNQAARLRANPKRPKGETTPSIYDPISWRIFPQLDAEDRMASYAFGMLAAFYSLLEFLLSALYALQRRDTNLRSFERRGWEARYEIVFASAVDPFARLRTEIRDLIDVHGRGVRSDPELSFAA